MIEQGYELDRLHAVPGGNVRWWLYAHVEDARPRRPRKGVADPGFRFARGGRAHSVREAQEALRDAQRDAMREVGLWRGQPSHALAEGGRLVPLGPVEEAGRPWPVEALLDADDLAVIAMEEEESRP